MKVLEFAFDSRDSGCAGDYLPHNYPENSVAYTGTHDNETITGWYDSITEEERTLVREYLCDMRTAKKESVSSPYQPDYAQRSADLHCADAGLPRSGQQEQNEYSVHGRDKLEVEASSGANV